MLGSSTYWAIVAKATSVCFPIVTAWLPPIFRISFTFCTFAFTLLHLAFACIDVLIMGGGLHLVLFAPVTICVILSCSSLNFTSIGNSETLTESMTHHSKTCSKPELPTRQTSTQAQNRSQILRSASQVDFAMRSCLLDRHCTMFPPFLFSEVIPWYTISPC